MMTFIVAVIFKAKLETLINYVLDVRLKMIGGLNELIDIGTQLIMLNHHRSY